ncbi:MAG: hypothetical protein Q8J76_14200 [Desulfobulbaceae bacterium]|nr:hypothetical protein [Desulfobulbaceae bacterium]
MVGGCHIKPEQFFNLIFGYYDRYLEEETDTNAGTPYNVKYGAVVPAGEIWVVTAAHAKNATRADNMAIGAGNPTDLYVVALTKSSAGAGEAISFSGTLILKQGDRMRWEWGASWAGDDINWAASGYKMKLSQ